MTKAEYMEVLKKLAESSLKTTAKELPRMSDRQIAETIASLKSNIEMGKRELEHNDNQVTVIYWTSTLKHNQEELALYFTEMRARHDMKLSVHEESFEVLTLRAPTQSHER